MLSSGLLLLKTCLERPKISLDELLSKQAKELLSNLDTRRDYVLLKKSSNATQSAATLEAHFDPNEMSSDGITLVSDAMVAKCSTGNNTHVLLNCGFTEDNGYGSFFWRKIARVMNVYVLESLRNPYLPQRTWCSSAKRENISFLFTHSEDSLTTMPLKCYGNMTRASRSNTGTPPVRSLDVSMLQRTTLS